MENVKDYYVEYIRVKQSFTKATRLQVEEVSKLKSQLQYYQSENYNLRAKLRKLNAINQAHDYQQVIDNVCEVFGISMEDLKGKRRFRNLVLARHIAMYIIRNDFNLTLNQVKLIFVCDHSTVIHACKQIQNLVDNPKYSKDEYYYYQKVKGI
jgi:chromosomal replication initiation ATPase DnaA